MSSRKSIPAAILATTMLVSGCGEAATSPPPRRPSGADGTYNCGDFDSHAQAQAYFDKAGDVDGLDRDGDGQACETLP